MDLELDSENRNHKERQNIENIELLETVEESKLIEI